MSAATQNPARSTVRRTLLEGKKMPDAISTLDGVCAAGAQCKEVTTSPVASAALADLQNTVGAANGDQTAMNKANTERRAAAKALVKSFKKARTALSVYETAVAGLSDGDAAVITKAGLLSRNEAPAATPGLEAVAKVTSSMGKKPATATLRWPEAPGATSYAIEVNFNPQDPDSEWTSLGGGTARTRLVQAPTPGAQFLARIAAVAGDGTHAPWSETILATTR